jgi:putative ABC transport system permease protein
LREQDIAADPNLAVYLPYTAGGGWPPDIIIHTAGEPTAVVPALRSILSELSPDVPLFDITTLEKTVGRSVASQRFLMALVSFFAWLALLLALAGVYGVQSYTVARRTSEIGVRVAMGATRPQIVRQIIHYAMGPALLGVAAGLAGAYALSGLMASLLFEVRSTDPATYAAVTGILAGTAFLSAWLPARRAANVDPLVAFRSE